MSFRKNNMNSKIVKENKLTDLHHEDKRISTTGHQRREMAMFPQGTGVSCEIHGQENFGIIEMRDGNGNALPRNTIKHVKVLFMDGTGCFEMTDRREDFWFQNGISCKHFCRETMQMHNTGSGQKKCGHSDLGSH